MRRLVIADAPAYRALMLHAYAAHPEVFVSTPAEREALPLSWWEARMGGGPEVAGGVLGAFAGDTLAGAAGVSFESREKVRHHSTLFGVIVRAEHRGRGLGRALVEAALRFAAERPECRLVQVTLLDRNPAARRLYESCGFQVFGTEPLAVRVGTDWVSRLHMWREVPRS